MKAFIGELPAGADGIEFWTDLAPSYFRPGEARWLLGDPGVEERSQEHAGIRIIVTLFRYGSEERRLEFEETQDDNDVS